MPSQQDSMFDRRLFLGAAGALTLLGRSASAQESKPEATHETRPAEPSAKKLSDTFADKGINPTPRLPELRPDQMTPEQQRLYQEIGGTRSSFGGPFAVWLRNPAIAEAANRLGNVMRVNGKLDRRLYELMVLVVARGWTANYEWFVHARLARNAGIDEDVILAIRDRRTPIFARDDERLTYEVINELFENKALSDATYARALAAFGLDLMIELTAAAGFYAMIAVTLKAFDVPSPDGSKPLG
jgi:4-carboxymuconolactone decarboxylase